MDDFLHARMVKNESVNFSTPGGRRIDKQKNTTKLGCASLPSAKIEYVTLIFNYISFIYDFISSLLVIEGIIS